MNNFLVLLFYVFFSYGVQFSYSDYDDYICSIDIDTFIYRQNTNLEELLDRQLARLISDDFHKDTVQVLNKELDTFMKKQTKALKNFRKIRSKLGCST